MARREIPRMPGDTVCFCNDVTRRTLRGLIAQHQPATVEELQRHTRAGQGCGTCRPDLEQLLESGARGEVGLEVLRITKTDLPAYRGFLERARDQTMFLRANERVAGIEIDEDVRSGVHIGVFEGPRCIGAVARFRSGLLCLRCPVEHIERAVALACRLGGRPTIGMVGPAAECEAALAALDRPALSLDSREILYGRDLADLEDAPLGTHLVRAPSEAELDGLARWRVAYQQELGFASGGEAGARQRLAQQRAEGALFVLSDGDGPPLTMSAYNAALPDIVQLGGVYTPPEHRRRGLSQACIRQALLGSRAAGVERAVLFTGEHNTAAQRCYEALGFERIGDYRICQF